MGSGPRVSCLRGVQETHEFDSLPGKKLADGTFFFFGCARHSDNTQIVAQFD